MKLIQLLVFYFILQPVIYSQDSLSTSQTDSIKHHRTDSLIHVGIELYPKVTGCFATSEMANSVYFNFTDSRLFALSAGITIKYSIKPWLLLSSGFNVQYLAARSAGMPADLNRGILYDHTILYAFKQAEIPLNFEFHQRSGIFAAAGASFTAVMWGKQSMVYQINPVLVAFESYTHNSNTMNLTLNAELGYAFTLKKFNQFRISASVQRFMKNNLDEQLSYPLELPALRFAAAGIKLTYLI